MNLTIEVPDGSTQHGNQHILCVKAPALRTAFAILTFVFTNYVAHAATVKSTPGDNAAITFYNIFMALVFPMSGLLRAFNAIARRTRLGASELDNACRAGALCMVVRSSDWRPAAGQRLDALVVGPHDEQRESRIDEEADIETPLHAKQASLKVYLPSWALEDSSWWLYFDTMGSKAYVDREITQIHGRFVLPDGYAFAIVPRNACLLPLSPVGNQHHFPVANISTGYSLAKAIASLIQVLAAVGTLLGYRSDLVERYGYASYHLTVIPYLVMSIVNLLSNMLTGDYPCLYMVESETMDEARARSGTFESTVAQLVRARRRGSASEEEGIRLRSLRIGNLQTLVASANPQNLPLAFLKAMNWRRRAVAPATTMPVTCLGIHQLPSELDAVVASKERDLADLMRAWREDPDYSATEHHDQDAHSLQGTELAAHLASVELIRALPKQAPLPAQYGATHHYRHLQSLPAVLRQVPFVPLRDILVVAIAGRSDESRAFVYIPLESPTRKEPTLRRILLRKSVRSSPPVLLALLFSRPEPASGKPFLELVYQFGAEELRTRIRAQYPRLRNVFALRLRHCAALPGFGVAISYAAATAAVSLAMYQLGWNKDDSNPGRLVGGSAAATKIHVPACSRFLRRDDFSSDGPTGHALPTGAFSSNQQDPHQAILVAREVRRGARWIAVLAVYASGCAMLGLVVGLLAWRSHGFDAGRSTTEERVIILLWICKGALGLVVPLLTVKETVLLLFVLPVLGLMEMSSASAFPMLVPNSVQMLPLAIACLPLAAFVPPVWGFVIVVRMMVEWGTCVRLY